MLRLTALPNVSKLMWGGYNQNINLQFFQPDLDPIAHTNEWVSARIMAVRKFVFMI